MTTGLNLPAARYKTKQAELLYAHLCTLPAEIAQSLGRARSDQDFKLTLETYFFACLDAARSVYFILLGTRRSGLQRNFLRVA